MFSVLVETAFEGFLISLFVNLISVSLSFYLISPVDFDAFHLRWYSWRE